MTGGGRFNSNQSQSGGRRNNDDFASTTSALKRKIDSSPSSNAVAGVSSSSKDVVRSSAVDCPGSQQVKRQESGNHKRVKASAITKHVNFVATVDIIGSPPYVKGRTDAETIQLYQSDIWYTNKDYAAFLKDRVDTIRIYRSVNGDMSCLQDHYSARGLEPYLQSQQLVHFQLNQQRLIAAVFAEQLRQKQAGHTDPAALSRHVSKQTAEALKQALERASMDASDLAASDEDSVSDTDSHQDSSFGDDDCSSPTKNEHIQVPHMFNVPMPDVVTPPDRIFSVDVLSLHDMNLHLVEQMRAKVAAKTKTKSDDELPDSTFEDIDKELEQWDMLYRMQRQRRDSLSGNGCSSASIQYTASSASDHALAISNLRRDSLSSTKSFAMKPSLFSLQQQGLPMQARLANIAATTSISAVRRDSLAGMRNSFLMMDNS